MYPEIYSVDNSICENNLERMSGWHRSDVAILIELYKNHKVLYNTADPNFHNKHVRQGALEDIAANLSNSRPTTVTEVRAKIDSLRRQFSNDLRKMYKTTSEDEVYKVSMWCFDNLLFLQDYLQIRSNHSNNNQPAMQQETDIGIEPNIENVELLIKQESNIDNVIETFDDPILSIQSITNTLETSTSRKRPCRDELKEEEFTKEVTCSAEPNDPWDRFGQYVAAKLRCLPPAQQILLENKILQSIVDVNID